ncbi:MAG: Ig-like domain-containing protein [Gemmatimonadetes bacterium]|nr:Ig-like domain-containing protein [Gemmatimonadota bacterium]
MQRRTSLLLAAGVFLSACSGGDSPTQTQPKPTGPAAVNVVQDSLVLRQQATGALNATVTDASGAAVTGTTVTWSSSRPDVAAVDAQGNVTTGKPGAAWVVASAGALRDSARVHVRPVWTRVSLSIEDGSTCALTVDGTAWCWGFNMFGQLGDGTTQKRSTPAPVAGTVRFSSIAVGSNSACGIATDGAAWCWGGNDAGQLGDGTTTDRRVPGPVSGGLHFTSIVAGFLDFCALTADGTAWCWGDNTYGELGVDPAVQRTPATHPVQVSGGVQFSVLYGGGTHHCGLTTGDVLAYCWGNNVDAELGFGERTGAEPRPIPVSITGVALVTMAVGNTRTCGADATGRAMCWGGGSITRQVLNTQARFTALAEEQYFGCGLTGTGEAWCWGTNEYGQLGTNPTLVGNAPDPVRVLQAPAFVRIDTGFGAVCGITAPGDLLCWGDNDQGQLGLGHENDRFVPSQVLDPS